MTLAGWCAFICNYEVTQIKWVFAYTPVHIITVYDCYLGPYMRHFLGELLALCLTPMGGDRNRNIFRPFMEAWLTSITLCPLLPPIFYFSFLLILLFCFLPSIKCQWVFIWISIRGTLFYIWLPHSHCQMVVVLHRKAHAFAFVIWWLCWCLPLQTEPSALTSEGIWRTGSRVYLLKIVRSYSELKKTWKLWKWFSDFLCRGDVAAGVCLSDWLLAK